MWVVSRSLAAHMAALMLGCMEWRFEVSAGSGGRSARWTHMNAAAESMVSI